MKAAALDHVPDRASEFREHWRVLLGAFFGVGGGYGSLYFYSSGLFLKPLAGEFGWSRGQASLGPLVAMAVLAAALPFAGRLVDRWGAARMGVLGLAGLGVGFSLVGVFTSGLTSFLLLMALLPLLSVASTPISFTRVVIGRFRRGRGLALGIAQTGAGLGATLLPALLVPLIQAHGWRVGYFALAGALAVIAPLTALLLKGADPPPVLLDRGAAPRGTVVRSPGFWALGALIFLVAFPVMGSIIHFVPLLTDAGMSPVAAAGLASALGLSVIGGRILIGQLLDRFDAGWVTAGVFALSASGMIALLLGAPPLLSAVLIGVAAGAEVDMMAYLVARRFAPSVYGAAYGGVCVFHAIGLATGPAVAGRLFDIAGDYHLWLITAATTLFAAAALALATQRGRGAVG